MYLKYYCLSRTPFGITPDPAFLYLSPSHKEALASLLYGIEKRKGFICLTGEVGCGKTTVLKALLERSDPERVKFVYLYNPELSFESLIRTVFEELDLEPPEDDLASAVRRLHLHLIELYGQGKHVALVVDEAQRMPVETLERLRILSNLETARDKLLQIVLCGQPELDGVLAAPELRQLRQRIALRATIRPLTAAESFAYINHRLKRVVYGKSPVFEPAALRAVARRARGNPRRINIICDNALVAAYADQKKPVPARTVREVAAGLEPATRWRRLARFMAAGCAIVLLAVAGAVAAKSQAAKERPRPEEIAGAAVSPGEPLTAREQIPAPVTPILSRDGAGDRSAAAAPTEPEPSPLTEMTETDKESDEAAMASSTDAAEGSPVAAEAELPPPDPPEELTSEKTYVVKAGDTLTEVLRRAYGHADPHLLQRTLTNNLHLRDPNTIRVGDKILLSDLPARHAGLPARHAGSPAQQAAGSYQ